MPDLLAKLDCILAELAQLRMELAEQLPAAPAAEANGLDTGDDFREEFLLDTHAAQERYNFPRNTIARWARQGDGRKVGGRWLISTVRLRRRINGGAP